MPIIDALIVVADVATELPAGTAAAVAEAAAGVFSAPPGRVWVRVDMLPASRYAENGGGAGVHPVFLKVLHADLPPPERLATEAAELARHVAAALGRASDLVHVEYAPPGRGRIAFGGRLLT